MTLTPEDLEAAHQIRATLWAASSELERMRRWLLRKVARHSPGTPVIVDGRQADIGGQPLDLVSWLGIRTETLCGSGGLRPAIRAIHRESEVDPMESLTRYVRQLRADEQR